MEGQAPQTFSDRTKWLVAFGLSIIFAIPSVLYVVIGYGTTNVLELISYTSASIASLLLATALSMGSINYFFGWPPMQWGFQKQFGVLAFWFALIYSLTLPLLYPHRYGYGLADHFFSIDVLTGIAAMSIFGAMVFINSAWLAPHFKRETIFFVLGLGYVGYALLVIRAIFLEYDLWVQWFLSMDHFPPGRLILSIIALIVLLLRVVVAILKHRAAKLQPPIVGK